VRRRSINATDPNGGTVWYKYTTGPTAEVFSVEVNGVPANVNGDAILQAFTYNLTPTIANLVFAEEDETSSMVDTPRLVINAAANTEYYFRVTSSDGDGFNFNIRLDFNPVAPANDTIATNIDLGSTLPIVRNQGDDIYSATTTDPTLFDGNTSGNNVWYRWTAPASGWFAFVRSRQLQLRRPAISIPTAARSCSIPRSTTIRQSRRTPRSTRRRARVWRDSIKAILSR
jgi:hypothetical protein